MNKDHLKNPLIKVNIVRQRDRNQKQESIIAPVPPSKVSGTALPFSETSGFWDFLK